MKSIFDEAEGWTVQYPHFLELTDKASEVFWLAKEIHVEDDINNFLSVATDSQRHAMETIAKVFVQQELSVANYWIERIYKDFKRPEIRAMATFFGMTEQAIHARFYAMLPEALRLDSDPNFYKSYHDIPEFEDRMRIIGKSLKSNDIQLSIATFAVIEKVTLFTQFAVIKSFNVTPYNLFPKVADGINFSAVDEDLHGEGGILLFKLLEQEQGLSKSTIKAISKMANSLLEHEYALLDLIYEKGAIDTVTKEDLTMFLHERWNGVMKDLGMVFDAKPEGDNPVGKWFYKGLKNKMTSSDNFAALSNTYNKKWQANNFEWSTVNE